MVLEMEVFNLQDLQVRPELSGFLPTFNQSITDWLDEKSVFDILSDTRIPLSSLSQGFSKEGLYLVDNETAFSGRILDNVVMLDSIRYIEDSREVLETRIYKLLDVDSLSLIHIRKKETLEETPKETPQETLEESDSLTVREHMLLCSLKKLVKRLKRQPVTPRALLHELSKHDRRFIWIGHFNKKYLKLPAEVLTILMQKKNCFSLLDQDSSLSSSYIAFLNYEITEDSMKKSVKKAIGTLLKGNFELALDYYISDIEYAFEGFRSCLEDITFEVQLGSILQKTARIEQLVQLLYPHLKFVLTELEDIEVAAQLCHADRATRMVKHFPWLTGLIGRRYSADGNYGDELSESLLDTRLPRFRGDTLPFEERGILLSIADRLDSLVGLFQVGHQPTSKTDPFDLRMVAFGLVQILVEKKLSINLHEILSIAAGVQEIEVSRKLL